MLMSCKHVSWQGGWSRWIPIACVAALAFSAMPALGADPGNVTFTARLDAWPQGEAKEQLVPVWVVIRNDSDQAIEVPYEGFSIIGSVAVTAKVSPTPVPRQILAGAAALEAIETDLAPIGRGSDKGNVPTLQPVGPADPTGVGGETVPDAAAFQHNYWGDFEASEWMYNNALRDGTIAEGVSIEGLLFFSRAAIKGPQARLQLRLGEDSLVSDVLATRVD